MEQSELSPTFEHQNLQLKQQISLATTELYQFFQKALDLAYPDQFSEAPTEGQPHSTRIEEQLDHIHNQLKDQLRLLAVQENCYNDSLIFLSQKLLSSQILQQQSKQMKQILLKYENQVQPTRTQLIEKQNLVYYAIKGLYQCFEDQYFNCTPRFDRISGIQADFVNKSKMAKQCIKLGREKELFRVLQFGKKLDQTQNKKQNRESHRKVEGKKQLSGYCIQEIIEDEEYEYEYQDARTREDKCLEDLDNKQAVLKKQEKYRKTLSNSKSIETSLKMSSKTLSLQQSTSTSLKTSQAYTNFNKFPSKPKATRKGLPNFSQMSKFDFNLFRIYYNKIRRQVERRQKLIQQYDNYKQVYKVVQEENQNLILRIQNTELECNIEAGTDGQYEKNEKQIVLEFQNGLQQIICQNEQEIGQARQLDQPQGQHLENGVHQIILVPEKKMPWKQESSYLFHLANEMNAQADKIFLPQIPQARPFYVRQSHN